MSRSSSKPLLIGLVSSRVSGASRSLRGQLLERQSEDHFAARLAMGPGARQVQDRLPRPPLDYLRRCYVDTALFGAPHAVRCVLEFFGPRQVLFGTDMPLGPASAVEATMADLEAAGLSSEDLAAVYAGNAVRLLGLEAGDR